MDNKIPSYLETLKKRAKESKVYRRFQFEGIEIAGILDDEAHTSLYIKLAKEGNAQELIRLAKNVKENARVKNKGAYFMSCLTRTTKKSSS